MRCARNHKHSYRGIDDVTKCAMPSSAVQPHLDFGLRTKAVGNLVIKDLESLRDNRAHAQDTVALFLPVT
jgi:hypothetical protein